MSDKISRLLSRCRQARAEGKDFPTIWADILKRDPLTLGAPVQGHDGETTTLTVRLVGDAEIVFDGNAFGLRGR